MRGRNGHNQPLAPDHMMRKGGPRKRGQALPNMGMNHGKRNISLDLKNPADQAIMHDLVRTADVFMENWRRGVQCRQRYQ